MSRNREGLREQLLQKKVELTARLDQIRTSVRRRLEADSAERASQLGDYDIFNTLGTEGSLELARITTTLQKLDTDAFGVCVTCGSIIDDGRLSAYPYASECIDCARFEEYVKFRR
jgi:RNA polymerase-binding transcription factor DksA